MTSIQHFLGSCVLSTFRRERLLKRFTQLGLPVGDIQGRYEHYVWLESELGADEQKRLLALLTYGEGLGAPAEDKNTLVLRVVPRFGTVSPWASKATDIAHNCGYYDQSHFIHDFRAFSGQHPLKYFSGVSGATEWRDAE